MTHFEVRKKFLDFFKKNQHKVIKGSPLIPKNDPSLLFVNAGMNQFKDVFLGVEPPETKNVATIQKCLRAGGKHNDLEEVGESSSHHTFFEMLGNFSFGGYFKEKAIDLAWQFLTEELKLSPKNLWVTVHKEDKESYKIWKEKQKIPVHKIYKLDDEDNFWQMGETGPCGYCAEIHYYSGKEKSPDPSQFIEVWNLVFMEFNQLSNGKREKLPIPCVDTGMGLERLCALLQNRKSNYHTDLFSKIISSLEETSGKKYDWEETKQTEEQKAFRVLADHSRAICFLINEDVFPGNERENYVLRRIIRRALYYSQKLRPTKNLLQIGTEKTISLMSELSQTFAEEGFSNYKDYFDLQKERDNILYHIHNEYEKFSSSLKEGARNLEEEVRRKLEEKGKRNLEEEMKSSVQEKLITAKAVWKLYNTYGFPMDLTRLIAKERGWPVATKKEVKEHIKLELESINERRLEKYIKESKQEQRFLDEKHEKNLRSISIPIRFENFRSSSFPRKRESLQITGKPKHDQYKKIKPQTESRNKKKIQESIEETEQKFKPLYEKHAKDLSSINKSFIKQCSAYIHGKAEKTNFTGYTKSKEEGQILFMFSNSVEQSENKPYPNSKAVQMEVLQKGKEGLLVLNQSCFYSEGGGPIGDKGYLKTETGSAEVLDCQKASDFLWHEIRVLEGHLKKGQKAHIQVDTCHRKEISASHTATHLLNSALRIVLGDKVRQAGSLVKPGYLRFDFTHFKALTKEQYRRVEKWVWQIIAQEEKLSSDYKNFEEAKKEGFLFLKNENYTDQVRVICVGENTSKELCGGIHVQNTKEIKSFKILSEKGVQSGVRRIEAWTGSLAKSWESFLIKQNLELRRFLKASESDDADSPYFKKEAYVWKGYIEKANPFLEWIKVKDQEIKKLRKSIVCLEEQTVQITLHKPEFFETQNFFHPLALQTLELREFLNCPLPIKKAKDLFEDTLSPLEVLQDKEKEIQKLRDGWKKIKSLGLTKENLISKSKKFEMGDRARQLLVTSFPIENRKILSDLSDVLLSKIPSGLLVLRGEADSKHPVIVSLTKDMEKFLSAGNLLKDTIAPFCKGQGGGKASFAQGSITDTKAFSQLEKILLDKWSK